MRKIKIMLLSLLVFAVVGGTLAFKARFTQSYCWTSADVDIFGQSFCPGNLCAVNPIFNVTINTIGNKITCTAEVDPRIPCNEIHCNNLVRLKAN